MKALTRPLCTLAFYAQGFQRRHESLLLALPSACCYYYYYCYYCYYSTTLRVAAVTLRKGLISTVALALPFRDTPAVYPVSRLATMGLQWSTGSHARDNVSPLSCGFKAFPRALPVGLMASPETQAYSPSASLVRNAELYSFASMCAPRGARHPAPSLVESLFQMLTCQYEEPWVGLYVAPGGLR